MHQQYNPSPHTQQGIVLFVGIMLLLILTLIGISAMNSSVMTEKLTQNIRDTTTAFEAAETALGDGEQWVQSQTSAITAVSACSTAPCHVWQVNAFGNAFQQSASWWASNALPYSSTLVGVAAQPMYIIEQYSFVPSQLSPDAESKGLGYYYYRITAMGTGLTSNSVSYVQSIYGTQFN